MSLLGGELSQFVTLMAFGLTAGTCWTLTHLALQRKESEQDLDLPNERSLHQVPVPRTGGFLMMQAIIMTLALLSIMVSLTPSCGSLLNCLWPGLAPGQAITMTAALISGVGALTWIGRLDDRGSLSVTPRLLTHLACAALIAFAVAPAASSNMATAFEPLARLPGLINVSLIFVVIALGVAWHTNLYNFMDGANGLAGLMSLIGFGTYALIAPTGSAPGLIGAACAGAALGFLLFNWDPARIFMGDAGSIPLGFLAAGVGLTGALSGFWHWLVPIGIFLPFIFDATITLALRACRGERITAAHRSHAYQILVISGLGHHKTALLFGVLMVICSLTSATSGYLSDPVQWGLWAVIILIHAAVQGYARFRR